MNDKEQKSVLLYKNGILLAECDSLSDTTIGGGEYQFDYAVIASGGTASAVTVETGGTISMSGGSVSGMNVQNGGILNGTLNTSGITGWYGAVICGTTGEIDLSGGTFSGNHAETFYGYDGFGGAVEAYQGTLNISGGLYEKNTATGGGGAVYAMYGTVVSISGAKFIENQASYGGAVELSSASGSITDCIFTGNHVAGTGGAVVAYYDTTLSITGSTFTSNSADQGAAVYNVGTSTVSGCIFQDNTARQGSAVYNGWFLTLQDIVLKTSSDTVYNDEWGTLTLSGSNLFCGTLTNAGVLYFNLNSDGSAVVDDFSKISNIGTGSYTVKAESTLENGSYLVAATNAASLKSLTLQVGENSPVVLQNGASCMVDDRTWSLVVAPGGSLSIRVANGVPSVLVNPDYDGVSPVEWYDSEGIRYSGIGYRTMTDARSAASDGDAVVVTGGTFTGMQTPSSHQFLAENSCFDQIIGGNRSDTETDSSGAIRLSLSGCTSNRIYGGDFGRNQHSTGDIEISLSGNSQLQDALYAAGGGVKLVDTMTDSRTGDITVKLSLSDEAPLIGNIFAGGCGFTRIEGNSTVELSGKGGLSNNNIICGDSSRGQWGSELVSGTRSLCFRDYQGEINSSLQGFDRISFDASSRVSILAENNLQGILNWQFEVTESGEDPFIQWGSEMTNTLSFDKMDITASLDEGESRVLIHAGAANLDSLDGFSCMKLTINGEEAFYYDPAELFFTSEYELFIKADTGEVILSAVSFEETLA